MSASLYINDQQIDLTDGVAFPLNFSIADAKEPQSRKRNFSKEITLPGTQNNMNFFASAYQLNLTSLNGLSLAGFNFQSSLRYPCRYYKNGNLVFRGMFQLKQVTINRNVYSFKCQLFSEIVDVYQQLKDIDVSELEGWEVYEHELNRTNQINSFDTSVIVNGSPVSNFSSGLPIGFGYVYALAEYGYQRTNPTHFKSNQIAPLIYVRETFIKCLERAGINYSSAFIDSQRFRSLVWGFGGGRPFELSSGDIANRQVLVHSVQGNSLSRNFITGNLTFFSFDLASSIATGVATITDLSSQFTQPNNGTQAFITVGAGGNYTLQFKGDLNISASFDTSYSGFVAITNLNVVVHVNGVIVGSIPIPTVTLSSPNFLDTIPVDGTVALSVNASDVITVEYVGTIVSSSTGTQANLVTFIDNYELNFNSTDTELVTGSTVDIRRFIPKMKASEFFGAIIRMFNLYVSDPDEFGVVTIEPFEDYYEPDTVSDDWTQKIDYSKEINIIPTSNIEGRTYLFKWADDNDLMNQTYLNSWGVGYGNRTIDVPSTFQVGEKVFDLPFSVGIPTDTVSGLILPTIIQINPSNNNVEPYKGKPKIYFYNGLKTGAWRLEDTSGGGHDNLSTYPSIHHFDDWESPTFDLNFLLPLELYYTTTAFTNVNLYTVYIQKFIQDLIAREAKIIELYVRLNAGDISQLRFERLKMINGALFRLNEVKDWDSDVAESTKVELLKYVK